jgi:hypothetical protein
MRVWYSSADRWRVDVIDLAAERDTYRTPQGEVTWDYGRRQLIDYGGVPVLRLPRGADLTPPELAKRLLSMAADQVTLAPLPARRVAGIDAAGVRLTPTSSLTTVGHIDIWADPASGLPLQVEVTGRSARRPFLTTRFLDVSLTAPAAGVLVPPEQRPDLSPVGVDPTDVDNALKILDPGPLPASLAGQPRANDDQVTLNGTGVVFWGPGIAAYGTGLARFLVISVPRRIGYDAERRAIRGGGVRLTFPDGDGVLITTPLVSVLAMDGHPARRTYLLAGLVDAKLLKQAGAELSSYRGGEP